MNKISFVFFTYNDAFRVEYAIKNVLKFGEVVVFDDGSSDNTKAVVENLGVKFLVRPKTPAGYLETPEVFDFVKQHTQHSWVYWGYVDNLLPKNLCEKLVELSKQDKYKYVQIPIHTFLWGNVETPVIKAKYPCFFKKEFMDFSKHRIHSLGNFMGSPSEILVLPDSTSLALRHYSLYDLNKFIPAHLKYANTEAGDKFSQGKKFSLGYLLGSALNYFWLFYKRGFKVGVIGFYSALLYSCFRLMVSVRLYELEHNLNLETIEQKFRVDKEKIVQEVNNEFS